MGEGRIFLKTGRDASFNKDLSNEPHFDRIHLAGHYLLTNVMPVSKFCFSQRCWQLARYLLFVKAQEKLPASIMPCVVGLLKTEKLMSRRKLQ
jgi:hypothetical protein